MDRRQKEEKQGSGLTCPLCHCIQTKHLVDLKSAAILLRRRAVQHTEKLRLLKSNKTEKEHEWGLVQYLMTCFPGTEFIAEDLEPCEHQGLYSFFRSETKLETRALDYISKRLLTQVSEVRYTLESLAQQCKLCVNSITEEREAYIKRKQADEQKLKVIQNPPLLEEQPQPSSMMVQQQLPQPAYFSFPQQQTMFAGGLPLFYIFPTLQ